MKFKNFYFSLFILLISFPFVSAQITFQSDTGSVYSGVVLNTDNFSKAVAIPNPKGRIIENDSKLKEWPEIISVNSKPVNSFYIDDNTARKKAAGRAELNPTLIKDFPGIPMTSYIPPDPNVAVGPNHIVALVNSEFKIWDKNGNLLKSIDAGDWFSSLYGSTLPGDPQIIYDHYAHRWIMVYHRATTAPPSFLYTAVSDDDNPLGVWHAWALPGDYNGHINYNLFADYPHIGYDEQAIYITTNQFVYGGYGQYARIRIIPKSDLYSSTAGTVHYTDFWSITIPGSGNNSFGISPTVTYGNTSAYYLISAYWNGGVNFVSLYKITNPVTSPTLTGTNVGVSYFNAPPDANQLGGGTPLIETNGAQIQERSYFKNDTLWAVHTIANSNQPGHSAFRYYKINVNTSTAIDEMTFGSEGHYYLFPALTVDQDGNVCFTYSRSGDNEYCGAYYSVLKNGDPTGYSGSIPLQEGKGNYVVTYGGTRNRWGDYMGIYLDPIDQRKFWIFTEYAESPSNKWGTWVGEIGVTPFSGPSLFSWSDSLNFKNVEVGTVSDVLTLELTNLGTDDVIISDIPSTLGPFHLQNSPALPYTLSTFDSLALEFTFTPDAPGSYNEVLNITSNDPNFQSIPLKGRGYEMNPAVIGKFYAVSGPVNDGSLYTVDEITGAGTLIGNSEFDETDEYRSLAISPKTGIIYGLTNSNTSSAIARINSSLGDAYILYTLPLQNMYAVTFDTSGTLYGILNNGDIYKINLNDGTYDHIVTADILVNSAAFDPLTNELWATPYVAIIGNKDAIYKIDLTTGTSTLIGDTGFDVPTNDIEFNASGELYGVIGSSTENNDFIKIDKTNGLGNIIGSINYPNIMGLAFARTGVTGVQEPNGGSQLPREYSLQQNYPNPFNPSTRIEYSLPVAASVKVTIYNLLGEIVNVLVNTEQNPGSHTVVWNSEDMHGSKVGSGVYFYELKANGTNGTDFTQIRKMILLK